MWSDLEKAKMMERLRKGRSSEGRRPTLEKMMTGILVMLLVIMIVFMMMMVVMVVVVVIMVLFLNFALLAAS